MDKKIEWFSVQATATLRRALGIKSPMNVWRKQFTDLSLWDYWRLEAMRELEFMRGDKWEIGRHITIKKPLRYANGPR